MPKRVAEAKVGDTIAERGADAVSGVGEHGSVRNAGPQGSPDLVEGDPRLGLERHIVRHAGARAATRVAGPRLWQVEAMGDRKAGVVVGE